MSTKIYNGLRFKDTDLLTIFGHIERWRAKYDAMRADMAASFFANTITEYIDGWHEKEDDTCPLSFAWGQFNDRRKVVRVERRSDWAVDYGFEIGIYPYKGQVYCLVFTERNEALKAFKEMGFVEDYGYWDNTDQPDGVSDEEWAKRECVWEGIVRGYTFENIGLTASCHTDYIGSPEDEHILKRVPSLEKRVKKRAETNLFNGYYKPNPDIKGTSDFMRQMREFEKWLKTEEGKAALEVESAIVKPTLLHPITAEHLRKPL